MLRVAIIYYMWPHYRSAVVEALDRSERIAYTFMGSGETFEGIPHMGPERFRRFRRAPFRRIRGRFFWQSEAVRAALSQDFDAIIYLADPNILSNWMAAGLSRLRRVPVLFWGHGWRKPERGVKRLFRNAYYRLSNRLLVYTERAKRLGTETGFPAARITTVYNSLDLHAADKVVARIEAGTLTDIDPRALFAERDRPLLICTARLIAACRFDLLIDAASLLAARGKPMNVLLVGDGPVREEITALARERGVDLHLYGACYDEEAIGQLIYGADLTVSPGKIGLTAMHSLMYGTPAITHDNLDQQMPEVEAINPGTTGLLFAQGDARSLADAIEGWFAEKRDRATDRVTARAEVHAKWNPDVQAGIIEEAVIDLIGCVRPASPVLVRSDKPA
ncbi:glycosyltransferase family 4 protein [Sphingomonas oryzagri]